MENPTKMDDLGGKRYHHCRKPPKKQPIRPHLKLDQLWKFPRPKRARSHNLGGIFHPNGQVLESKTFAKFVLFFLGFRKWWGKIKRCWRSTCWNMLKIWLEVKENQFSLLPWNMRKPWWICIWNFSKKRAAHSLVGKSGAPCPTHVVSWGAKRGFGTAARRGFQCSMVAFLCINKFISVDCNSCESWGFPHLSLDVSAE